MRAVKGSFVQGIEKIKGLSAGCRATSLNMKNLNKGDRRI
jgi:hypothetical protein